MHMQHQRPQRRVIRIRQVVDALVQRVPARVLVFDARGVDEAAVARVREQGIGQVAEELLEEGGNAVDVLVEVGRVAEVDGGAAVVVELVAQHVDVRAGAREAVDAFDVQAEGVDREDALDDDHGHGGLVAVEELVERDAEDGPEGGELGVVLWR